jgi:hypothetical protein
VKLRPLRIAGIVLLCVLAPVLAAACAFVVGLVTGYVSETAAPVPSKTIEKIVEVPAASAGSANESR